MNERVTGLMDRADEAIKDLEAYQPNTEVKFSGSLRECMGEVKFTAYRYDAKKPETQHALSILESSMKVAGAKYAYVEWATEHGVEESIFVKQDLESDGVTIITEIDPALSLPGAYFVKNIYVQSKTCAFNVSKLSPEDIYMTTDANAMYSYSKELDENTRYVICGSFLDISKAYGMECGLETLLQEIGHARSLQSIGGVILETKRETINRAGREVIKHIIRGLANRAQSTNNSKTDIDLHPIYQKHANLVLNSEFAASQFALEVLEQMRDYEIAQGRPYNEANYMFQRYTNRLAYFFNSYVNAFKSIAPRNELDVSYNMLTFSFDENPTLAGQLYSLHNIVHQLRNNLAVKKLTKNRREHE